MSLIPKKGTVYIVDDDEGVRDSLSWLLEGKGYRTQCFSSAENFLDGFDPHRLACLITDIRMAGASGLQLQDKLVEMGAPLPIAFITGHGDVPLAVATMKLWPWSSWRTSTASARKSSVPFVAITRPVALVILPMSSYRIESASMCMGLVRSANSAWAGAMPKKTDVLKKTRKRLFMKTTTPAG